MEPLLDLAQAATYLNCGVSTLRKLLKTGNGPRFMRIQPRGHYKFKREWLDNFVEQTISAPSSGRRRRCRLRPPTTPYVRFRIRRFKLI